MYPIKPIIQTFSKWTILILLIGLFVGSSSAFFLWTLDQVTKTRLEQPWLLFLLPFIGVCINLLYTVSKQNLTNGNSYIMRAFLSEPIEEKKPLIPFLLTPLVLVGTLLTHLGGGSAGREGTAVQMGASIASQLSKWISLDKNQQRLLTCIGISAGFAGVFGTPLAASIFAIEFFSFKKIKWFFILPCLLSAYLAHFVCLRWGIQHAHYQIISFNNYSFNTIGWIGIAGIVFGLTALLYIQSGILFSTIFSKIKSTYFKSMIGGLIIVIFIYFTRQDKMAGLGLQTISDAFIYQQGTLDFLIKLLLTSLTLNAGFKGGEVTPLFFIGAVLGSTLIAYIPLPISLLAGLGLIAVFAGATHCVLSAILLGIELYGLEYSFYIFLVCAMAYLISGNNNIYEGKPMGKIKKAISNYFF